MRNIIMDSNCQRIADRIEAVVAGRALPLRAMVRHYGNGDFMAVVAGMLPTKVLDQIAYATGAEHYEARSEWPVSLTVVRLFGIPQ